ncbi:hypothetical protein E4P40_18265 [Blastococcus sp. CT_GayMR20]|uniref:hypothetical protein n=1 Tax=Blastococcus sp. CT_GayMR20 TaxID=2559609 RepID=UPI0010731751|nr:hypothetical protein [Blastococcus sp. CT_GayMR20]TFV80147.1 hypothetical protein E4P40_18265 [Blastococcus sp. CT_GayMR20]
MANRRALVAVSAVQLAAGLVGQVVALRRRRPYDVPFMHGSPDHVARDSLWFGASYSAPVYMTGSQLYALVRLAAGPDERARTMLRLLGTTMIGGYLVERFNRKLLTPSGFDPLETPIVVVGLAGSVAMAVLARP